MTGFPGKLVNYNVNGNFLHRLSYKWIEVYLIFTMVCFPSFINFVICWSAVYVTWISSGDAIYCRMFNLNACLLKGKIRSAGRDGSGLKHTLLFHRAQIWFSAPMWQFITICSSSSRSDVFFLASSGSRHERHISGKVPTHIHKKEKQSKHKHIIH